MLRGQGSLQQLFGKRPGKNNSKRPQPTQQSSEDVITAKEKGPGPSGLEADGKAHWAEGAAGGEQSDEAAGAESGVVRCPLCRLKLSDDNDLVNSHIDACLSKGRGQGGMGGPKTQATLFKFAAAGRRESSPACGSQPAGQAAGTAAGSAVGSAGGDVTGRSQAQPSGSPVPMDVSLEQLTSSRQGVSSDNTWSSSPSTADAQQQSRRTSPRAAAAIAAPSPPRQQQQEHNKTPLRRQQHHEQQQQQQAELKSPCLLSGSPASSLLTIPLCLVVGRRHQSGAPRCPAGQRLSVAWEENNPRDPHALLASHAASGAAVGHLPFRVAFHLAPLLRHHGVVVEAVVLEEPDSDWADLPVELQVSLHHHALRSPGRSAPPQVSAGLQRAAAAAAEHAAQPRGSGERLRANFFTLLATVLQHDAHLLDEGELEFARLFKELPPACGSLLLRLFLRKGPWFRAGALCYDEVPDVRAALGALRAAGLVQLVVPGNSGGSPAAQDAGPSENLTGASIATWDPPRFPALDSAAAPAAASLGQPATAPEGADGPGGAGGPEAAAAPVPDCPARPQPEVVCLVSGDSGWEVEESEAELEDDASTACTAAAGAIAAAAAGGGVPAAGPAPGWEGAPGAAAAATAGAEAAAAAAATATARPQGDALQECLQEQESCLAAADPGVTWQELANLLTVPELAAVLAAAAAGRAAGRPLGGGSTRAQLLEALGALAARDMAVAQRALLESTGAIVRLSSVCCEAIQRLQRLFFLNEGHTLSQFLAADLGGVRYPQYSVRRTCSAFASRCALLAYERALRHAEALQDGLECGDQGAVEQAIHHAWAALDAGAHKQLGGGSRPAVPLFLRRFDAGWVYCMIGTVGVSLLEQQRNYKEAVSRLQLLLGGECCPGRRGEWWLRLSIDTEHLGRPEEALEVAEAALADEWLSHGDRLALQRRVLRLGKPPRRWRKPPWAAAAAREPAERQIERQPLGSAVGMKSRFCGLDGQECGVEELALQYYASEEGGGWRGMHSEGGVWATLFGLLMWEVLFSDAVPDVLRTPFQTAPLDLDTDAFYEARKGAVEAVLARVRRGEAPDMLAATWQAQRGVLCRGVDWERYELEQLQVVARCIGGPGLAAVCQLLAEDHAGWSGGMPDLLLWHPARGAARLSEVKGPRDRLSDQQRAWMRALADAGLDVEVLKVVEPGAGRKRKKGK